ncbi:hypothetical protein VKT23_013586 [Stygiomarasmius scandens]|uniref:Uncharacterized protein n=1 Tax=Marasmiellus scandens TaxID=2682957 RepID=A0ABR1J442_9AGAR
MNSTSFAAQELQIKMKNLLLHHLSEFQDGVQYTLQSLTSTQAEWRGQKLLIDTLPSPRIAHEVLWELYEISFRLELVTLDRQLAHGRRQSDLHACWRGPILRVDFDDEDRGLGSTSLENRLPYLRALHNLMQGWPGPKPLEIENPFPTGDSDGCVSAKAQEVEEAMAHFYVRMFFNTFHRPAVLPHHLP